MNTFYREQLLFHVTRSCPGAPWRNLLQQLFSSNYLVHYTKPNWINLEMEGPGALEGIWQRCCSTRATNFLPRLLCGAHGTPCAVSLPHSATSLSNALPSLQHRLQHVPWGGFYSKYTTHYKANILQIHCPTLRPRCQMHCPPCNIACNMFLIGFI